MNDTSAPTAVRPKRRDAGFSLMEIIIGGAVLAVALLGHTASIFSEHRLSRAEQARSTALLASEQFVERLRSDDDWPGLFARLNTLQAISRNAGSMTSGSYGTESSALATFDAPWFDRGAFSQVYATALHDYATLTDGRIAFPPQSYYPDFVNPTGFGAFHLHVEVPSAPQAGATTGQPVLREDLSLTKFGLPADLNGDGFITDASRDDDYRVLPVVVTIRYTAGGEAPEELRISTWLWGYR
jgi:hypothetical protein